MHSFSLSFRNRIALSYLITTALMVLFVFVIIYNIVSYSMYSHVDHDIALELNEHLKDVIITDANVKLINPEEWREQEHQRLDVNPVFVQIMDSDRKLIDRSPNLKEQCLEFDTSRKDFENFNAELRGNAVRQIQFPIVKNNKTAGYILVAMSLEYANLVLGNLQKTMLIAYPLILILLFFTARLIAGRNIHPIRNITETAKAITKDNLKSRIALPENKDELYVLSNTINNLLDRIENAIDREKQFTSDASHELRTPLAVIKGTLEVLIRKPREKQEYEEKINYCINEVNRLNVLVDQLLLLARFENQKIMTDSQFVELNSIILQSLERFSSKIEQQNITIDFTFSKHFTIHSDGDLVSVIIENLLSNAIKYSPETGKIKIALFEDFNFISCEISDNGIGIQNEDLAKIYNQFFRSQPMAHTNIRGSGLGLSIVKRLCDLLQTEIHFESDLNKGTKVRLNFPK